MPYSLVEAKKIEDLCTIVDCEHKTAPYVDNSNYLVVRTSNVRNGQLVFEGMKYTTSEGFNEWTQRATPTNGDVLFTREAPAGEACLVPSNLNICMGQRMVLLRPKRELVDPIFLSLYLTTARNKSDILRLSIGSTVSRINISDIRKLRIACPPLVEQNKIAKIVSSWEKAIAITEQLLANSQQHKSSLMQKLLTGKKRFPEFREEWLRITLGKLVGIKSGTSKSEFINDTGSQLIIDMGSVSRDGKLIPSKRTDLSKDFLTKGQLVMPKDDIGGGNIIGKVGYIDIDDKYILGDHVYALSVKNCDSLFLCYLINSPQINKSLRRKANGTAQLGLGKSDVQKQHVTIPQDIKEQQKIASVLAAADRKIQSLQQKLGCLNQEKKALMQQLLTGKKRVTIN